MLDNFMTAEMLGTFAGLTAAVTLIVQFTKSIIKDRFNDIAVRIYAYVISLFLMFIFAHSGVGVEGVVLNIINAILITVASFGTYELIDNPLADKEEI